MVVERWRAVGEQLVAVLVEQPERNVRVFRRVGAVRHVHLVAAVAQADPTVSHVTGNCAERSLRDIRTLLPHTPAVRRPDLPVRALPSVRRVVVPSKTTTKTSEVPLSEFAPNLDVWIIKCHSLGSFVENLEQSEHS